jgi:hypothetical protein
LDPTLLQQLNPRTPGEIVGQLRELIHRHRRRYIRRFHRACPNNCVKAEFQGNRVSGCSGCHSTNPEQCHLPKAFVPVATKDELYKDFADDMHDIEVLRHDYRDLLVLMWVLGIDPEQREGAEQMASISASGGKQ